MPINFTNRRLACTALLSSMIALLALTGCKHKKDDTEDVATSHTMSDEDCSQDAVQASLRHAINEVLAEESRKTSSGGLMQFSVERIHDLLDTLPRGIVGNIGGGKGNTLAYGSRGMASYEFSHFQADGKLCYVNVKISVDMGNSGVGPIADNEPVSYTVLYLDGKPYAKIQVDSMRRILRDLIAAPHRQLAPSQ